MGLIKAASQQAAPPEQDQDDAEPAEGTPADPDAASEGTEPDANAPGGQPTEGESDDAAGGGPSGEIQAAAGSDHDVQPDGSGMPQVPATKQQQAAYDKANAALYHVLYGNDGPINAVVKGIQPQAKIDSCAKLSLLLLHQIDAKMHLDEAIVLPFTKDIVSHVIEIAEQAKKIPFSDPEAQAVLGASLEGAIHMFGVTKQQVQAFLQHIPPQQQQKATANYHAALQNAKAGQQADPQDQGDSDAPSANQAAESQQQPTPQAGAGGAPPAGGGGQLSQAAQLQQQQQVLQQSAAQGAAGGQ